MENTVNSLLTRGCSGTPSDIVDTVMRQYHDNIVWVRDRWMGCFPTDSQYLNLIITLAPFLAVGTR